MTGLQSARPLDMRDLVSHVRIFITEIKEQLDADRTLVLVPWLSLLKQTMQMWAVGTACGVRTLLAVVRGSAKQLRGFSFHGGSLTFLGR